MIGLPHNRNFEFK